MNVQELSPCMGKEGILGKKSKGRDSESMDRNSERTVLKNIQWGGAEDWSQLQVSL
jgi:hypothetical protein